MSGKPIDEAVRLLREYREAPKFSNDHDAIKRTVALEDEIDAFLAALTAAQQQGQAVSFDFERARTLIDYVVGYARAAELKSLSSDACVALRDLHTMLHAPQSTQQGGREVVAHGFYDPATGAYSETQRTPRWLPAVVCTAPPSAPVGVKTLSEFMAEQEALHPGIHDKVQAATDELRASLAQRPAAPSGEAVAGDADFLRHIASVCRSAFDLCQPKPQRTPEDPREHYGGLCLLELTSIADEIERRLAADDAAQPGGSDQPQGGAAGGG